MFEAVLLAHLRSPCFAVGLEVMRIYSLPDIGRLEVSVCGNFSQPIYRVSKASVPSVRCSNKSSSLSASFSPALFLRLSRSALLRKEPEAATGDAGGLDGEYQVAVVLPHIGMF